MSNNDRPVKLGIAIPTYNEAANLKKLLPKIKASTKGMPNLETIVYVIDDNSPDGTAEVAKDLGKELKTKNFNVKIINRAKKEGLGKAYIHGFKEILKTDADLILQMDADLSHNPKYIPQFIELAKDTDLVIGSRYVKGGGTADWSWNRKFLSRGGNLYTRAILDKRISDYTGGFNLYSEKLLRSLPMDDIYSKGYGFLIDLKYRALGKSKSVAQVPIIFTDRLHGKSKMPKNIIISNLILVPKIRLRH
ncbi:MAG TPA: polyprenol monophosphomannose synthase [Candidatus Saccharimonadales bacterium]